MLEFLGRSLHQSYFVVVMCGGIVFGTILALVFRINYFASPIWIGCALALMILAYCWPKMVFVVIALVAGMILSFVRSSVELVSEDYIRQFYGKAVIVSGVVDGDPETDGNGTKFKLKELKFGGDEGHVTGGSLYISEYKNEDLAREDKIVLNGKLMEGFGTYAGYMYKPEIKSWLRPEPGDLILKVRNWFAMRVESLIPEPQVRLGLSYLLGMKSGLPDDLDENLRVVGLVHIVVASGAHLSILVGIARKFFGRLSRFSGLIFSILFVVFFMVMVGWTPSIMRAGIMTILTLLAWYVGRKIEPWRIILLVAAGTLLVNPMFIINLGWLLSFASFAGIMILGPKFTKFCYGGKKPGFVAGTIITTVAATVMTLPIVLYYYGTISLISVIANLLILPTLPYAMGLVFLTGVVAGLPGVETVVAFVATKLLDFHIVVVEFFGEMKSFMVEIEPYQAWVFGIYFLIFVPLLIGLLWRKMVKLREAKILI
ncbi:ComEC/Rec2 family competence protein [Candidatus Nanosyncoccus alces]|uniref:ComE operon protein 3 n=1 Tax=Candidatus Nanosyncoccus alces TaxID=2171997 RepID=A0ABY0FLU1_9BACT|nr:ComEC/Rec2 family competence protein [Candidatus Nanosyncoccus alces]RYC74782.1 ComE operon protein 3 [Candidatus Nanosyncoccus alces]